MLQMISECSYTVKGFTLLLSPFDVTASCTITLAKSAGFIDHHSNISNQVDTAIADISMYRVPLRLHLKRPGLKITRFSKFILFNSSSP